MAEPYASHRDDAPFETYERDESGFEAISRRLVTRNQTEALALYVTSFAAPVDYSNRFDQDLVLYITSGSCSIAVDDKDFQLEPGSTLYVPRGSEIHHLAVEDHEMVIAWSPAPELQKHR
jgi:quercetin dioxygenase-like cupin family protein